MLENFKREFDEHVLNEINNSSFRCEAYRVIASPADLNGLCDDLRRFISNKLKLVSCPSRFVNKFSDGVAKITIKTIKSCYDRDDFSATYLPLLLWSNFVSTMFSTAPVTSKFERENRGFGLIAEHVNVFANSIWLTNEGFGAIDASDLDRSFENLFGKKTVHAFSRLVLTLGYLEELGIRTVGGPVVDSMKKVMSKSKGIFVDFVTSKCVSEISEKNCLPVIVSDSPRDFLSRFESRYRSNRGYKFIFDILNRIKATALVIDNYLMDSIRNLPLAIKSRQSIVVLNIRPKELAVDKTLANIRSLGFRQIINLMYAAETGELTSLDPEYMHVDMVNSVFAKAKVVCDEYTEKPVRKELEIEIAKDYDFVVRFIFAALPKFPGAGEDHIRYVILLIKFCIFEK